MLDTPILFLVFNRPDTTQRVFDAICLAKPRRLFIAADGARPDHDTDTLKCQEVRKICEQISWPCKLEVLYRPTNLGCADAVAQAIDWFFEQVEFGIILEDDTLPSLSFFRFCELLLQKYLTDPQVMTICGTNYLMNTISNHNQYFLSKLFFSWGWATWRRAWKLRQMHFPRVDLGLLSQRFTNLYYRDYFYKTLLATQSGNLNTWDVQWAYSIILQQGLNIVPYKNQIKNIGYQGTHSSSSSKSIFFDMAVEELELNNLLIPATSIDAAKLDDLQMEMIVKGERLKPNWKNYLKSLIRLK